MATVIDTIDPKVRLKRYLAVGPVAPGQWLVRDGPQRQWTVGGPTWLAQLFSLLGDGRTVPALTRDLEHVAAEDEVRQAVSGLLSADILEWVSAEDDGRGIIHHSMDVYLSHWGIGPAKSRTVRAGCPIALAASGLLAQDIQAALGSSGVSTVALPLDQLEQRAGEFALLVGAADHPDQAWLTALSGLALRYRVPWLYLTADCEVGWIGPLFVPGETACWCCFQHRLNSNRRNRELYESFIAKRGTGSVARNPMPAPPPIRQAVASLATMEIMRFLFGHEPLQCAGRVVWVGFSDFHTLSEAVLKIPGCPECNAEHAVRPAIHVAHEGWPDPAAVSAICRFHDLLIGRHCGIVRRVRDIARRWDDPDVFIVSAELADLTALGATVAPSHSGGVGLTRDDAWLGAIGEAAERYCAALAPSRLPARECAWSDLQPTEAVDPDTLAIFSGEQYHQTDFPARPFHRDTRTTWLSGRWLTAPFAAVDKPCWMPAECVGLGFARPATDKPVNIPTSNGLAAGPTLVQAVLAGLCEVIERDAFVVAWFNGLSAPRVDLRSTTLDWLRDLLQNRLLWPRIEYHVADLTSDAGVPVYAVISRGPSEDGPIVSFGAACHPFARLALTKALLEAAAGRAYVRQLVRSQARRAYRRDFEDVRAFEDHAQFYTRHARFWKQLKSMVGSEQNADLEAFSASRESDKAALEKIATTLETLGHPACWCDLTTPDVAAAGLHAVRVLVPGMQPLHGDHRLPFLGGLRHTQPERVFSWTAHVKRGRRFRRLPHPYP